MAMNESRQKQMLAGQSALARKVFQIVPIQEHWSISDIYGAVRAQGTSADTRTIRRCLGELKDVGLIREPVNSHFQRTMPATKPQKENDMPKESTQKVVAIKKLEPLDALAGLSGEVMAMAEDFGLRMKGLASRIEEVALSVEADREDNSEQLEKLKQLQSILKSLQG
ncbi:hypothetical protein LD001_05855 [Pseudomonas kurunegalensis]|uniref:hypothetical protein n=1 Tax=Pseudomonas kurunegalensis TaxID=485880 RepID=UPI001CDBB661|nr:hypothetical protein [Pseudomonas kurunegalensis]MCA4074855.1 hypothetical protein [Pseudomonas kurunegalensis]